MAAAVAEYREARGSSHSWVLGRFVCPASSLEQLASVLVTSMRADEAPWAVSVVLDGQAGSAAVAARSFDDEMEPAASVAMVELQLPAEVCSLEDPQRSAQELTAFVSAALAASPVAIPFFDMTRTPAWRTGIPATIRGLALHRDRERRMVGAGLRCGGRSVDAFPSTDQVVSFLSSCRTNRVPFKATAGPHHAISRHDARLGVVRHGFLNLIVAAALCESGASDEELRIALDDTAEVDLSVGPGGVRWRETTIGTRALQTLRMDRLVSYECGSFAAPVSDLIGLGILRMPG